MNPKINFTKRFVSWFPAVCLFIFSAGMISCNGGTESGSTTATSKKDTGLSHDTLVVAKWLDVAINFSPGTSASVRQTALQSVENLLIDTLRQLRQQPTYAAYNPEVSIFSQPARDSLTYHVMIASIRSIADTTCDCMCTCPTCRPGQCPCSPTCPKFLHASATNGGSPMNSQVLSDVADTVKVNDVVIFNK